MRRDKVKAACTEIQKQKRGQKWGLEAGVGTGRYPVVRVAGTFS